MKSENIVPLNESKDWRDVFLRFLRRKNLNSATCRMCGEADVELTPGIVTCARWDPEKGDGGDWSLNGVTYPLALMACSSCGHINLYSASLAGLKKEDFANIE